MHTTNTNTIDTKATYSYIMDAHMTEIVLKSINNKILWKDNYTLPSHTTVNYNIIIIKIN